jgi:rhodanese-related sulfurtransferase
MLTFAACATSADRPQSETSQKSAIAKVSPKDAADGIRGDVQVIDVRSESEFNAYRIEGSRNIPITEFDAAIQTLDKTRPVYLVCEVGLRSTTAAEKLSEAGFPDVRHIEGGLRAWGKAGLPVQE